MTLTKKDILENWVQTGTDKEGFPIYGRKIKLVECSLIADELDYIVTCSPNIEDMDERLTELIKTLRGGK
jgi:hypothetical protein